jgi:hypothetical protein
MCGVDSQNKWVSTQNIEDSTRKEVAKEQASKA